MQKVKVYHDIIKAQIDMEYYISKGWRIHTCSIGSFVTHDFKDHILVIYENKMENNYD